MLEVHVSDLAARILQACVEEPPQTLPVLLGDGCAKAAGVPAAASMARSTLKELTSGDGSRTSPSLASPPTDDSDDALVEWFRTYLGGLGHIQRHKLLEPCYRTVPVPAFYRDLADLVMAGYVTHVLTTNVDSLFEQALERLGMRKGSDYEVVVLGSTRPLRPASMAKLRLVKLHGDLGESQLPVGPEEIEQVLYAEKSSFRRALRDELIVVGHLLTNSGEPVNDWLWRSSEKPVWWALPEQTQPAGALTDLENVRPINVISGPDRGTPESFFARLSFRLLRLPALQATDIVAVENPDEDTLEVAFHRSELLKSRAATHDLQEHLVPGLNNEPLFSELAQQRSRLVHQEAQLAVARARKDKSAEQIRRTIADFVDRLVRDTDDSLVASPAVSYLRDQALLILRETGMSRPDSRVMNVAVAGVVALTEALGDDLSPKIREGALNVANVMSQAERRPSQ